MAHGNACLPFQGLVSRINRLLQNRITVSCRRKSLKNRFKWKLFRSEKNVFEEAKNSKETNKTLQGLEEEDRTVILEKAQNKYDARLSQVESAKKYKGFSAEQKKAEALKSAVEVVNKEIAALAESGSESDTSSEA